MTTTDKRIERLEAAHSRSHQVGMVEFIAWYRNRYGDKQRKAEERSKEELEAVASSWMEYCKVNGLSWSEWLTKG